MIKRIKRHISVLLNLLREYKHGLNLTKTIYANFKLFDFSTAIGCPVFIYGKVAFNSLKGNIYFNNKPYLGCVKIGQLMLGTYTKDTITVVQLDGAIYVKSSATFGAGCRISIGGKLYVGDNFLITGASTIICHDSISFGDDVLLSWENLIMDIDFHKIIVDDNIVNRPKGINIGNHVWIGCRCTILKGVTISDGCVVAASSVITKSTETPSCVVSTCGKILKQNINWTR